MSKSFVGIVLLLLITIFSSVSSSVKGASVIPEGLVLYWSFDDSTVKGQVVKDVLGKRDGSLEGNPKVSPGKFDQGLEFD